MRSPTLFCAASLFLPLALSAPAKAAIILPENTTDVTLTSAPVLTELGVSVAPTGRAALDTSGAYPVAMFPITGGVANPDGSLIIRHDGSDLALSAGSNTVDIGNFVISTKAMTIDGDVVVNGSPYASMTPLFNLAMGSGDFVLTLTSGAAGALNAVFDTDAFTTAIQIGTAVTNPVISSAVPELSTWIMLCMGFGLLGVCGASRSRSLAAIDG